MSEKLELSLQTSATTTLTRTQHSFTPPPRSTARICFCAHPTAQLLDSTKNCTGTKHPTSFPSRSTSFGTDGLDQISLEINGATLLSKVRESFSSCFLGHVYPGPRMGYASRLPTASIICESYPTACVVPPGGNSSLLTVFLEAGKMWGFFVMEGQDGKKGSLTAKMWAAERHSRF